MEKFKYTLINCKIELILTWFKNCVLISKATREANYDTDLVVRKIDNPENATFQITDTKLYVPVVTLSIVTKAFRAIKIRILKNYKME